MSNESSTGGQTVSSGPRSRFGWLFDPALLSVAGASVVVVFVGGMVQISHGSYSMSYVEAWYAMFNREVLFDPAAWQSFLFGTEMPEVSTESLVIWNIRLPRVIVAVFVGMNLAVSGAIFQAVTRNELASPFILGVSSGAGLAILLTLVVLSGVSLGLPLLVPALSLSAGGVLTAALTVAAVVGIPASWLYAVRSATRSAVVGAAGLTAAAVLGFGLLAVVGTGPLAFASISVVVSVSALLPLLAAVGGITAFLIVYAIAWKNGTSPVRLVLAGVIVSTIFTSLQTSLFFFADNVGVVQSAVAWTNGSLTGADWEQVRIVLPWSILAMGLAMAGARQLNVLLLGEQTARSLGVSVERVRFGLASVAVLAAAASIAVAGIVSFVGLIVPHLVRSLVGTDYKKLIVGCLFVGPALMVVADVGARLGMGLLTGSGVQVPVGIVTGLIGGPYFLYLMRRQENIGEI
ncbi:iron chelate uptake ABC transporter family permease subunit [Halovenus sp. WSH3]|uniref:Iron chelate uptake ABC transporter family permease subunit n=1 Tax=Halovenus carboxidivorans TaxID=2692199 RepID=A0A6B0T9G1_9EURY|nr:iron ABC transporter permease [Halovenus carboxidivorans]MXR51881.1 iron chelate uptake ABC transporter family permease subunit [Halovenus carboxidivorans]